MGLKLHIAACAPFMGIANTASTIATDYPRLYIVLASTGVVEKKEDLQ